WMARHDAGTVGARRPPCPVGTDHAPFRSGARRRSCRDRWLATQPPIAERIARLIGEVAPPMVAERGGDDELALDHARAGSWLALSALPPLVYVAEGSLPDTPATGGAAIAQRREAQLRNEDMAALVAASHNSNSAAAIAALLVLGGAVEQEIWPLRWRAAMNRQAELAM